MVYLNPEKMESGALPHKDRTTNGNKVPFARLFPNIQFAFQYRSHAFILKVSRDTDKKLLICFQFVKYFETALQSRQFAW